MPRFPLLWPLFILAFSSISDPSEATKSCIWERLKARAQKLRAPDKCFRPSEPVRSFGCCPALWWVRLPCSIERYGIVKLEKNGQGRVAAEVRYGGVTVDLLIQVSKIDSRT